MRESLGCDSLHHHVQLPAWLAELIDRSALGQKTWARIVRRAGEEIQVFDPAAKGCRPTASKAARAFAERCSGSGTQPWRFTALRGSSQPQAQFLLAFLHDLVHCGAARPVTRA